MKRHTNRTGLVVALFLLQPAVCLATTGGAETVHSLLWDANAKRVWFVKATGGGYGRELGYFDTKKGRKRIVVATGNVDDSDDRKSVALDKWLAHLKRRGKPLRTVALQRLSISAVAQARAPRRRSEELTDPGQYEDTLTGLLSRPTPR